MAKPKKSREKENFPILPEACRKDLEKHYIVIPFKFQIGSSNPNGQTVEGYVLI